MWLENLLVFILFKLKKCPNISGIQVVNTVYIYVWVRTQKRVTKQQLYSLYC